MSTKVYKSRQHNKLGIAAFVLLSLISIGGLTLWRLQSIQVMSVESSSMAPNIRRGDAVVLRPVRSGELRVGDVVSYRSPADQSVIITHRITVVQKTWRQVITKGDGVDRTDAPVPMTEIIGRVNLRVAYAGFMLNFLRHPIGLAVCVYAPALYIVIVELRRLAMYYTKPTYRRTEYQPSH